MQEYISYVPKKLPVYGRFDVVVIGGGTAGAAAAISAAEEGLNTLVLEKNGFARCGIIYIVKDPYPRIAYEKKA